MKLAIVYPPEYDGELHIFVDDGAAHAAGVPRTISCTITVPASEAPAETLRKLGKDLVNQPIRKRYEG